MSAGRTRAAGPGAVLALAVLLSIGACGGAGRPVERPVPRAKAPALRALALLPDRPLLRSQILVGDLDALRRSYRAPASFRRALSAVWLPDALAGVDGGRWPRTFGFGAGEISRFAAAGFHPAEVAVVGGRFSPATLREKLGRRGYREEGTLLVRGADGAFDAGTIAGQLALSSLNRVEVSPRRLVAASTTALSEAAAAPRTSMAANRDLSLAATALGGITAAVIKPARLIQPPAGVPVTPIVRYRARLIAAGVDDRGSGERTLKIALVYGDSSQARADAEALRARLARTPLLQGPRTSFGRILTDLRVELAGGRAVLVRGTLPRGERSGLWRDLVEGGDLSVLVGLG